MCALSQLSRLLFLSPHVLPFLLVVALSCFVFFTLSYLLCFVTLLYSRCLLPFFSFTISSSLCVFRFLHYLPLCVWINSLLYLLLPILSPFRFIFFFSLTITCRNKWVLLIHSVILDYIVKLHKVGIKGSVCDYRERWLIVESHSQIVKYWHLGLVGVIYWGFLVPYILIRQRRHWYTVDAGLFTGQNWGRAVQRICIVTGCQYHRWSLEGAHTP